MSTQDIDVNGKINTSTVFEHPLSERVRLLLRLEQFFKRLAFHLEKDSIWDTHAAISVLLRLVDACSRSDLKGELIIELNRQKDCMLRKHARPYQHLIQATTEELSTLIEKLIDHDGRLGNHLKSNDFLQNVQQRCFSSNDSNIVGLPIYQLWLDLPPEKRRSNLLNWLMPIKLLEASLTPSLANIRSNQEKLSLEASKGYFHQTFTNDQMRECQIIQVQCDDDIGVFPKLSAGKHGMSIQFYAWDMEATASQRSKKDVHFTITFCGV